MPFDNLWTEGFNDLTWLPYLELERSGHPARSDIIYAEW